MRKGGRENDLQRSALSYKAVGDQPRYHADRNGADRYDPVRGIALCRQKIADKVCDKSDLDLKRAANGIITVDADNAEPQPCIKCGRCVDVCPMELKPLHYFKLVGAQDWQGCKDMNIMDCMECRCCEYICSSKLPLVTMIKMGKNGVRGLK